MESEIKQLRASSQRGIAAGSGYDISVGAADYICVPRDRDLITNAVLQNPYGDVSIMYGAEYEDNFFGGHVFDNDVPCAVCYAPQKSVTLMVPGKDKCYNGWIVEYSGKFASGSYKHGAASQYVCLDGEPEVLPHGQKDENGKLFYPVKTACGSLPCPPYQNNAFMTCVVCSK